MKDLASRSARNSETARATEEWEMRRRRNSTRRRRNLILALSFKRFFFFLPEMELGGKDGGPRGGESKEEEKCDFIVFSF